MQDDVAYMLESILDEITAQMQLRERYDGEKIEGEISGLQLAFNIVNRRLGDD